MVEPILGEGLALQSNFRPTTEPILTKSLLRADEMDMKKALQKQKQEEAKQKRMDDIYGKIKPLEGKLNPYYQSKAKKEYSQYINQSLEAAKKGDQDNLARLNQDFTLRAQGLKEQSDKMDEFLNSSRQGFLVPPEIAEIRELSDDKADAKLRQLLKDKPEYSNIINVGEDGSMTFNQVKDVPVNKLLTDALEASKELATEQVGSRMIDKNTREFIRKIPKDKIDLIASNLALDADVQNNLIVKDRKGYDAIYDKLEAANPNGNPMELRQMAVSKLLSDKLEGLNQRSEKSDISLGKASSGIGNGFVTPNKWGLFPSQTIHDKDNEQFKAQNTAQLIALNKQRRAVNEANRGKAGYVPLKDLTYDEAYPKNKSEYDEVVFENQDVSENKTFKYPNSKGGLIDVTPISIRRKKGSSDWVLVGKQAQQIDGKTTYKDIELPYTAAVRQKTDAILGTDTDSYLRNTFGESKKTTNAPKQTKAKNKRGV